MKKITITTILMISLVLLTSLAFATSEEYEPEYYDNAKVVRVKYTQGESFITRSYDEGREEGAINLPIFEKDSAGTTDGRMEIYLGRLNYLRLDQDSEVVFEAVPELRKTAMTIRIIRGGIYLDVENLDFERDIEIQTPDCGVFLLDKGTYRFNVTENGRTEFFVNDGMAEVAGENYNQNVQKNQKIVMFNGQVKERPFYFYASDYDDFDQWNLERKGSEGYAKYSSNRYLEDGYGDYEAEMSRNGSWRYDNAYSSYVWSPYNMGVDWRPYSNGRWVWNPYYGYVWTSYDSCGYFTHHYGRWHWDPISRWCWVPGYHWSPAWVSWFWDDDYYGWCPMSYWNRPIIIVNNHWMRNYDHSHGIPMHGRSTTIIRKSQLTASHVGHAALKANDMGAISKKSLVFRGKAPGDRPILSNVRVIDAKGKTAVYKKDALLSTGRYKPIDRNGIANTGADKDAVYKYSGSRIAKDKISKYSASDENRSTSIKANAYKYKSDGATDSQNTTGNTRTPIRYKPSKSSGNTGTSSDGSGYKYTPKSSSSDRSTIKSSSGKSGSSSGSNKTTIKKKKDESYPSYSSYSSDNNADSATTSDNSSSSTSSYQPKVYQYNPPAAPATPTYSSPSYKERRSTSSYSSTPYKSSTPAYKERSTSSYSAPARSSASSSSSSGSSIKSSSVSSSSKPAGGGHASVKSSAGPSTSHSKDTPAKKKE